MGTSSPTPGEAVEAVHPDPRLSFVVTGAGPPGVALAAAAPGAVGSLFGPETGIRVQASREARGFQRFDKDHIGLETTPRQHRRGIHVVLIKRALNAFARRFGMDELDETNDVFDQETADLVTTFKELPKPRPILNFRGQIDKTTLHASAELRSRPASDPSHPTWSVRRGKSRR